MNYDLIKDLKSLRSRYMKSEEINITAYDVAKWISLLLSEVVLKDEREDEKLDDWHTEVRLLICEIIKQHIWTYDHCCYWGHQYCITCRQPKYPELNKLKCSEAKNKVGDISEEEYEKM